MHPRELEIRKARAEVGAYLRKVWADRDAEAAFENHLWRGEWVRGVAWALRRALQEQRQKGGRSDGA